MEVTQMAELTEAQKRAHGLYIKKFARLEIRTTKELRDIVQAHAVAQGESVSGFINRAIKETIERDQEKGAGA
jgi:uncharacterized protein (DUF1778 family)